MTGDPESSVQLAREHFEDLFDRGEVDREPLAEGFRVHANSHAPRTVGEQLRAVEVYREAFPDLSVSVEDAFATGDRVALRGTVTGTQEGELLGIAPTGATVEIPWIAIYRVSKGLLAEMWAVADNAGLRDQLRTAADPDE